MPPSTRSKAQSTQSAKSAQPAAITKTASRSRLRVKARARARSSEEEEEEEPTGQQEGRKRAKHPKYVFSPSVIIINYNAIL